MGFKEFVKDALTVFSFKAMGFLIILIGVFLITANSFLRLGLSQEIEIVLGIVGFVLIIVGGLFVRYTYKRIEPKYNV